MPLMHMEGHFVDPEEFSKCVGGPGRLRTAPIGWEARQRDPGPIDHPRMLRVPYTFQYQPLVGYMVGKYFPPSVFCQSLLF